MVRKVVDQAVAPAMASMLFPPDGAGAPGVTGLRLIQSPPPDGA